MNTLDVKQMIHVDTKTQIPEQNVNRIQTVIQSMQYVEMVQSNDERHVMMKTQ